MTSKRFTLFDDGETIIDNESVSDDGGKQIYWTVEYVQVVKLVELLNELHEENDVLKQKLKTKSVVNRQYKELQTFKKENEQLKSDLAKVIEQASKNDKFLRSDMKILKNALWCPNCANDIKRLKELRKEFLE